MAQEASVGVIGLGRMGMGLGESLAREGFHVLGFDTDRSVAERAGAVGIAAASMEDVAACPVVLLVLPDGPDVRAVTKRVLQHSSNGALIIDCSTVDPSVTKEMADEAAGRGVRFRDAGMAGGPADAAGGTLLFMVGCPEEDFADIEAVLGPISRGVVRCGDTGAGVTLKVVNNLLALSVFLADVEALALARSAGLDVDRAVELLNSTGAANAAMTGLVINQLLPRNFEGAFRTSLAYKDVRIAVELASRLGVDLKALGSTREAFAKAVDQGLGDLAAGAAGLPIEEAAGISLAGPEKETNQT